MHHVGYDTWLSYCAMYWWYRHGNTQIVVDNLDLFSDIYFNGFTIGGSVDYLERLFEITPLPKEARGLCPLSDEDLEAFYDPDHDPDYGEDEREDEEDEEDDDEEEDEPFDDDEEEAE